MKKLFITLSIIGILALGGWSGNKSLNVAKKMCINNGDLDEFIHIRSSSDLAVCNDGKTKVVKW